jgi:hypothetical protein
MRLLGVVAEQGSAIAEDFMTLEIIICVQETIKNLRNLKIRLTCLVNSRLIREEFLPLRCFRAPEGCPYKSLQMVTYVDGLRAIPAVRFVVSEQAARLSTRTTKQKPIEL